MRVLPWLVLALLPVASAQFTSEEMMIESHDGTELRARLYTPEVTPAPAILLTHGWGENIDSGNPTTFAERFAAQGYVVLAYDSRGWGDSGGQVELDGPNEVKDAQELITFLARQDSVLWDGAPDDPRIGMVGQSYAGGIQFLTAQVDPRIDAIAPFSTWSNLLHSLAPNDVVKRGWVDLLFASGQTGALGIPLGGTDPGAYDPDSGGMSPDLARWYATIQATNAPDDEIREELGVVRSLSPTADLPPTFLGQGWPDTLFTPEDSLMTWQQLRARGVDARLHIFDMGHGFGNYASDETVMPALDDFMAQHLRGEDPQLPPYPIVRYRYAEQDYVGEMRWPPAGSSALVLHITDDGLSETAGDLEQTLVVPPVPAHCTEVSNFQSNTGDQCGDGVEGTFMTFATAPFTETTEVTGTPQLVVPFTSEMSEVFLFFQVVDIAPDGTETSVLSHVKPVRLAPDAGFAFLNLHAITHTFEAGHAAGIRVSTTDLTYMGNREAGEITLTSATGNALVALPIVPKDAHGDRSEPSIQRGYLPASGSNSTETMRITLRDNLALGDHTLEGPVANVTVEQVSPRERVLHIDVEAPCGTAQLTIAVEDLVGLEATRTFDVVPCPQTASVPEEAPKQKDSPAGWLLLPLLAALVLRRKP